MRLRPALLCLALVLSALGLLAPPARAATSLTWTGATSNDWGTAGNWSPGQVPAAGDTVTINGATAVRRSVTGVPAVALAGLTISTGVGTNVDVSGPGPLTTGTFSWTGGNLDVPLTVTGSGSVAADPPNPALYGGSSPVPTLTVAGTLDLLGPGAASANEKSSVETRFDADIAVTSTGTLRLANGARLLSNRCCTTPTSTLASAGTISVLGGQAALSNLGLDLGGTVQVPAGSTLDVVGGPARVTGGATLSGGGLVRVPSTSGPSPDANQPLAPEGALKLLGNLAFAGGTTLELGSGATLSGVGDLTGSGALRLAGGSVRAATTIGVPLSVAGGTTSKLTSYDAARAGQHAEVTLAANGLVESGAALRVDSKARLVVSPGRVFGLFSGSTLTSDGCCTDPGRVTVDGELAIQGGTVRWVVVGGGGTVRSSYSVWDVPRTDFASTALFIGSGDVVGDLLSSGATVVPDDLRVSGDWRPGPTGGLRAGNRFRVGGTAYLSGARLDAPGAVAGSTRTVLEGKIEGRFGCLSAPGAVATYAATSVSVVGVAGAPAGCLAPASGTALKGRFRGKETGRLKPPAGATTVLLQVTLKGKGAELRLRAGGRATVSTGKARKVTTLVALRLGAGRKATRLTAKLDRTAAVKVTTAGYWG